MAVPVGGFRAVDGALFYYNGNNSYENTLIDLRSRMLETQDLRSRQSYKTVARNYGNVDEEMYAERDSSVTTPNTLTIYNHRQGTPLFLEQQFANNDRYVGIVGIRASDGAVSTDDTIYFGTNSNDVRTQLHIGEIIEINGEARTVTGFTAATATAGARAVVTPAFSAAPPLGSQILIKGREYVNPNLNESYRVTDKYGSYIVDGNRYQVDRDFGIIRYRPTTGSLSSTNSIWHIDAQPFVPYYFGKLIQVKQPPPPAGPTTPDDGVVGNEELGMPDDPVRSANRDLNGDGDFTDPGEYTIDPPTVLTSIPSLTAPDGQYSNIRITAPAGVSFQVELNGAILAVSNDPDGTHSVTIPFFDPDYENDQLKANQGIDPDIYIQRFVKAGNNNLVIKATQTGTATGIRVEGYFNGINLSTGAIPVGDIDVVNRGRPQSSNSVSTLDWSASRHSILGIAGKVDYDLGDRIALEDVNDEVQKAQGVLESLTTIIAGTDVNQFQSLLSVIR